MIREIEVAHTPTEVLVWQAPTLGGQRVITLHTSGPALRRALALKSAPPTKLQARWLSRQAFDELLAQALPDPDGVPGAEVEPLDKVTKAQHRLATRFAQVRVVLGAALDLAGRPTGGIAPAFSLRGAARHALVEWTLRVEPVDLRDWASRGLSKAHRPHPYPVDPATWGGWMPA